MGMTRRALALVATLLALAGCSDGPPEVSEEAKLVALASLDDLAASAGIGMTDESLQCAFDRLGQAEADTLAAGDQLDDDALPVAAEAIVECVGHETIAEVILAGQAPVAGEAELACAASKIDDSLVTRLVVSSLEQESVSRPQVELSVATALARCLEPESLLDQG